MTKIELHYYEGINGRTSMVQFLLEWAEADWSEVNYKEPGDMFGWFAKDKQSLIATTNEMINLPYVVITDDEGKKSTIAQTVVIMEQLGDLLLPKLNPETKLKAKQVAIQILDLRDNFKNLAMFLPQKSEKQQDLFKSTMANLLQPIEVMLTKQNSKFLCGNDITFVDFMAFNCLDFILKFNPSFLKYHGMENLQKWFSRLALDEKIAKRKAILDKLPYTFQYKDIFESIKPFLDSAPQKMKDGMAMKIKYLPTIYWGVPGKMDPVYE